MMRRQLLLFKAESPLDKRFAADFFKTIPTTSGVYYFRNSLGNLLYVGKAKNLRRRVASYKQIKLGKSSKKLLRLVNETWHIAWEVCGSEEQALIRENSLLRTYKPPFNRMNTWPENYVYLHIYKSVDDFLVMIDKELNPQASRTFGAFKSKKFLLPKLKSLLRLVGYLSKRNGDQARLDPAPWQAEGYFFAIEDPYLESDFYSFLKGESEKLLGDVECRLKNHGHRDKFVEFILGQDLLIAREFFGALKQNLELIKMAELRIPFIRKELLDDLRVRAKAQK